MSKVSVYGLKRPKELLRQIEVEDDSNPGVVLNFTFRQPDIPTAILISQISNEKWEFYSGSLEGLKEKPPLPLVDGKQIELTRELSDIVCTIQVLQVGETHEVYSYEELLVVSLAMPKAFASIVNTVQEIMGEFNTFFENPTKAVTIPHSDYITTTTEDIQN